MYAGQCSGRKADGSACRSLTRHTVTVAGIQHIACEPHADQVTSRELDLNMRRDHAEALAENAAHDLAMEKATEPTVEQLVQFATQRTRAMPQALRNRINSARALVVVPPGRMQA